MIIETLYVASERIGYNGQMVKYLLDFDDSLHALNNDGTWDKRPRMRGGADRYNDNYKEVFKRRDVLK